MLNLLHNNIVLIGFMGTLKSALGYMLAKRLNAGFIDTNDFLETRQKRSTRYIQSIHGPDYLRALERHVVARSCEYSGIVISCSGSIPYDPHNMALLRRNGFVVWLTSSPRDIIERAGCRHPLSGQPPDEMINIINRSAAVYSKYCDMAFDTSGGSDRKSLYDLSYRLHLELSSFQIPARA